MSRELLVELCEAGAHVVGKQDFSWKRAADKAREIVTADIVRKLRERAISLRGVANEAAEMGDPGMAHVRFEEARGADESADWIESEVT